MRQNRSEWTRIDSICDGLTKYGIEAVPSEARPSWLVIQAPTAVANEAELLWGEPPALEIFVSDVDLLRSDCVELVLNKVTSVVGHPC